VPAAPQAFRAGSGQCLRARCAVLPTLLDDGIDPGQEFHLAGSGLPGLQELEVQAQESGAIVETT